MPIKVIVIYSECLQSRKELLYLSSLYFSRLDLDECNLGTHGCHGYATCNNTAGSYTCECDDGYTGDGFNCTGKVLTLLGNISHLILFENPNA